MGQCHEIFDLFLFSQQTLPGPHMNRLKRFRELCRFCQGIRLQWSKITCPCSQWLRGLTFFANIFAKMKNFDKPILTFLFCCYSFLKWQSRDIVTLRNVKYVSCVRPIPGKILITCHATVCFKCLFWIFKHKITLFMNILLKIMFKLASSSQSTNHRLNSRTNFI